MVNRNLIRSLESDETLVALIDDLASGTEDTWLDSIELEESIEINKIVEGRILRMDEEFVLIDIGGKSEGSVARNEWDEDEDPPEVGAIVRVLVEDVEDEFGRTDEGRVRNHGAQRVTRLLPRALQSMTGGDFQWIRYKPSWSVQALSGWRSLARSLEADAK